VQADTAPETRPRRATTTSTLSHATCDADHRLSNGLFGPRHFCSTHDAHRISCRVNRSSPRGFRWAHARQPSCNLVARSAGVTPGTSPSGGREVRSEGVRYYSVDLGRVQRGGRDNDADRDVTVIPVIPGRRPHQGRCRGAGHHGRPPRGRRRGPGPGTASPPGVGTLGHQFQLRMARSFPLSGRCRRAGSPVPVAHCRSSRSQGVSRGVRRHQFQLRTAVPSGSQGVFGRGRSHGYRCAAVRLRARVCAAVTRSSGASRTFLWVPPGDGPEGLYASPPLRVVR
jgi:hypothetical protein